MAPKYVGRTWDMRRSMSAAAFAAAALVLEGTGDDDAAAARATMFGVEVDLDACM